MTKEPIMIDGVDVKDCRRRIGKANFCRYYKRPCAENNYNCIWKKYLRKEQECEKFKQALQEIKEIANKYINTGQTASTYYDILNYFKKQIIQKCEVLDD